MLHLLLLLGVVSQSWAVPRLTKYPFRVNHPLPMKSEQSAKMIVDGTITMPIDHFNPQNEDTFQMRFMSNEEYFGGPGYPIYIAVGDARDNDPNLLVMGNMFKMAYETRGYLAYTEHRFYGHSLPYQDFTVENLRYLTVDQALADLAYFIRDLKKQERFADSKVILYGCSYAGNMAVWFKQRYPHLVEGVIATGAPLLAKVDFNEYLETVHESFLLEGSQECVQIIRQGLRDTARAISTEEGRKLIEENYRLCNPLKHDNVYDLGTFSAYITRAFSDEVEGAYPGSLLEVCGRFVQQFYGTTPMEQIGGFITFRTGLEDCYDTNYDNLLENARQSGGTRAWLYQLCTQFGGMQSTPRSGTVFDSLPGLTVDFLSNTCKQVFGPDLGLLKINKDPFFMKAESTNPPKIDTLMVAIFFASNPDFYSVELRNVIKTKFDEALLQAGVERTNQVYGGLHPNVNNTINIHGYIDPWRALGVHDRDLSDTSPTHLVPRASHCFDLASWDITDTILMSRAQQAARRLVASWLAN